MKYLAIYARYFKTDYEEFEYYESAERMLEYQSDAGEIFPEIIYNIETDVIEWVHEFINSTEEVYSIMYRALNKFNEDNQ